MKNTLKLLLLFLFLQNINFTAKAQDVGKHQFIIYGDKNFKGKSRTFTYYNEKKIGARPEENNFNEIGWDKSVSSIKVGKGLKVVLFSNLGGYGDENIPFYEGGTDDLMWWNDRARSFLVEIVPDDIPLVALYDDLERSGTYQKLGPGTYDIFQLLHNDMVSAVEVPENIILELYDDTGFTGDKIIIDGSKPRNKGFLNFRTKYEFHDKTTSLKIIDKKYGLFSATYDGEPTIIRTNKKNMGGVAKIDNLGNSDLATYTKTVSVNYIATLTTQWNNSTALGLSISTTIGVEVELPLASVSSETTITGTIENTFTFGKETSESKSIKISDEISAVAGPNTIKKIALKVTEAKLKYNVKMIYAPIIREENGRPVFNLDPSTHKEAIEVITIETATQGVAFVTDITPKNNPIQIGSGISLTATNGELYCTVQDGSIFKYNGTPNSWTKIGGYCLKLVSTKDILYNMERDGSIYKYVNNKWVKIGGYAKDISTNNGNFYYLKNEGSIFKYNGTGSSYTKIGGYGLKLVSTNGILYQMAEDGSIFKYVYNQWIKIGGYAKDIATNNGNFYYLKNEGSIFKYNGTGSSYTKIGGYGEPENWTKQIKNFNHKTTFGSNIYYLDSTGNIFKK